MIKFRALSKQELLDLETEFKQFLIIHGLHDAEWKALAKSNPKKAQGFIDLFSNIVIEKIYQNAVGLLQTGTDFITVFNFNRDPWEFYYFKSNCANQLGPIESARFLEKLNQKDPDFKVQKGTKEVTDQKAQVVHELITKGAQLIDAHFMMEFEHYLIKK